MIDPLPDLALEIDIASRTHINTYEALGVPELWRRSGWRIRIYVLPAGQYVEVEESPTFPKWPLKVKIPQYLEQSRVVGRNKTMKAFCQWVRNELEDGSLKNEG